MDISELKQIVDIFVHEADEMLSRLDQLIRSVEKDGPSDILLENIHKTTRSLKGSAAALGFSELAEFTHHLENFVLAVRKNEIPLTTNVLALMKSSRDFIESHTKALRTKSKSPGRGETLITAMAKEREPRPVEQLIQLPRPAIAGDIWFVGEDLKAELFELPEPPPQVEPDPLPQDPKLLAIQAEISRLTQLAAAVNLTTVQAATQLGEDEDIKETNKAWSLEGIIERLGEAQNATLAQEVPLEAPHDSTVADTGLTIETAEKSTTTFNENVVSADTISDESDVIEQNDASADLIQHSLETETEQAETAVDQSPEPMIDATPIRDAVDPSVRISIKRIDKLIASVGELIMLQTSIEEQKNRLGTATAQKSIAQLSNTIRELQDMAMGFRMVSAQPIFTKASKLVKRLTNRLGKEMSLSISGEDILLDKITLDRVGKPISEIIRNALIHGIEHSEDRVAAGKNPAGTIKLELKQNSRAIIIEVIDDGRGLNNTKIRETAIACGLLGTREAISDEKLRSFIFHPDFARQNRSETETQTLTGLAFVAHEVHSMNGKIELDSSTDQGTTIRILLPLGHSIVDGFVVRLGTERFVIAKSQIAETLHPDEAEVNLIQGRSKLLNLRGMTLPLFQLNSLLRKREKEFDQQASFEGTALVVLENNKKPFAVVVDDIVNEQQVVIKQIGRELQGLPGLTGAAILGDGKPALILDLAELVEAHTTGQLGRLRGRAA